ncbi:WRKY transcription factor 19 [Spatholobus suberectus]|nr:WRKY transcription factor 19 [Spatholobus suberectus]
MGREIVRQESPLKPGERSRLWFSKDILHVFKENKGSDKTEIIMLNLLKDKAVQWDGNALKKMENLKILVVENAHFSKGPSHLPKSLRVLKWCQYPEPLLPADCDPKKFVILDLSMSFFSFDNQLIMKFKSLSEMKLSSCKLLKKVPDLSGAPNLKKLHLDDCKNLVEVHDSIGFLHKLEVLNLDYCTSLRVLPCGINLPSLETLSLRICTSLKSFPEILGKMENIRYIYLNDSAIRKLPFSIGNLVGLTMLTLSGCNGLLELPSSIFMFPKLEILQANSCKGLAQIKKGKGQEQETTSSNVRDVGSFPFERKASFGHCCLTDEFLATLLPCLHRVTRLYLMRNNITILPSCINACHSLTELYLDGCKELREIRGLPQNIIRLSAVNCTSLTSQSKGMLLTQSLHRTGDTCFCFPVPGSTIQSLFNHCSRGPSLSFWFRGKFPMITLCVVGALDSCGCCVLDLFVNSSQKFPSYFKFMTIDDSVQTNHIILFNLQLQFCSDEFETMYTVDGWNHAEISFSENERKDVEWMGVYVKEQKTSMADIRFTNPEKMLIRRINGS